MRSIGRILHFFDIEMLDLKMRHLISMRSISKIPKILSCEISWVSELSQSLLHTSNLLKDVSHFTQKFASNGEIGSMQSLEADFFSLSRICKETYKLGFNIFAEARTFTKTCSRRLDLVLSVARDDRLNNAQELLTRMSEVNIRTVFFFRVIKARIYKINTVI